MFPGVPGFDVVLLYFPGLHLEDRRLFLVSPCKLLVNHGGSNFDLEIMFAVSLFVSKLFPSLFLLKLAAITLCASVSPKVLALLVSARLACRPVLGTNDIRFLSPLSVSVT